MSKKTKAEREAKQARQLKEFGGLRSFECPQCEKQRLIRPHNYKINKTKQTYNTYDGGSVELYTDVCNFCISKNKKQYFEPTKTDLRKLMKAIKENKELEEGQSLEDIL